jgi:hypothetical protein
MKLNRERTVGRGALADGVGPAATGHVEARPAAEPGVLRATDVRTITPIIVLGVGLLGAGCVGPLSDEVETSYRTLAEARSKGAVGDGGGAWIPEILPEAATDIFELHDIATNATWGCFRPNGQAEQVVRILGGRAARPVKGRLSDGPTRWLRTRDWWPESMTRDGLEVFEFKEPSLAPALSGSTVQVGIDRKNNVTCFRRTR